MKLNGWLLMGFVIEFMTKEILHVDPFIGKKMNDWPVLIDRGKVVTTPFIIRVEVDTVSLTVSCVPMK